MLLLLLLLLLFLFRHDDKQALSILTRFHVLCCCRLCRRRLCRENIRKGLPTSSIESHSYIPFVLPASTAHANAYFLKCFKRVFAKIRYYSLPLFSQNQLHYENKYRTPPRSHAIGQAVIVTDFGSKKHTHTCFFLLSLACT